MKRTIDLSDEALSSLKKGQFVIIKWSDTLFLKVQEYTISEEMADEFEEYEIIFEPDVKGKK